MNRDEIKLKLEEYGVEYSNNARTASLMKKLEQFIEDNLVPESKVEEDSEPVPKKNTKVYYLTPIVPYDGEYTYSTLDKNRKEIESFSFKVYADALVARKKALK